MQAELEDEVCEDHAVVHGAATEAVEREVADAEQDRARPPDEDIEQQQHVSDALRRAARAVEQRFDRESLGREDLEQEVSEQRHQHQERREAGQGQDERPDALERCGRLDERQRRGGRQQQLATGARSGWP